MAQVGRISGPLLFANLERNGKDLAFRNDLSTTQLLYLDVNNNRIGVNNATPTVDLEVTGTTQTTNLISDLSTLANFTISSSDITATFGNINLGASEAIVLSNFDNGTIYITDNVIYTNNSNANIDITPNGTGTTEVSGNVNVFGDIYTPGNITFEGSISFGDNTAQDTVTLNTDVNSDIIPDQNDTYNLGSNTRRWETLYTNLVNGQNVSTDDLSVGQIDYNLRQGQIIYVAQNGTDTNTGDHILAPVASIRRALELAADSNGNPVVVYVYPGDYEEETPLVVPSNVSVVGADIRNVNVFPTSFTLSEDVFHLNGETTIQNLTVRDFYYNDNKGYAFRFAPGAVISSRSPYVQNVSVITKGTNITLDDPRGFASGDAGRGAYVDGAELNSSSVDASMLFHSVTFITPGADGLVMTNGVRVEWLNSFTYFADRGIYAFNNSTGRVSQDGSTIKYGAELRSIGSANVYGNYGAVADGADTLMYLIQHNMAYIGAGKDVSNDKSIAIQTNEVVEENGGTIHYVTTNHLGNFRIGDNFFIDFETGNTTINLDTLTVNQFTGLRVTTGSSTAVIDGEFIDTGNLTFANNTILSRSGDLNITGALGTINLQNNTNITGNLDISGNLTYDGVLNISGDEDTDSLTFNTEFEQDFNPNLHQTYKLGSFEKKWLLAHLNRLEAGDYSVYDNVIETNASNANNELLANGTGEILVPTNNLQINNNLTVGTTTRLQDTTITGNLTHVGNKTQTGNITQGGELTVDSVYIEDNFVTTTSGNTNLVLEATVGSTIYVPNNNVKIDNNLTVGTDTSLQNTTITGELTHTGAYNQTGNYSIAGDLTVDNVYVEDNFITTTSGNLTLGATGDINVDTNDVEIAQDLTVSGLTSLQNSVINQRVNISLNSTLDNPSANGTGSGDNFGFSVATTDTYTVVGAWGEDSALGAGVGIVYVYNTATGNLIQTIENPNTDQPAFDTFGRSVDIDNNLLIVGATGYDEPENGAGVAYIFDVTDGSLLFTLNNPNAFGTSSGDNFGHKVSISGSKAIVSAINEDDANGNRSGKAYIFDTTDGSLLYTLDNPNAFGTGDFDSFGQSIDITDNYAIVGASENDAGGFLSGKAYIYDLTTGNLLHTLDNPNPFGTSQQDYFGYSVAISGERAIVGAYLEDDSVGLNNGKAYIFDVTDGSLLFTLDNPNAYTPTNSDNFGYSVAISGERAIVGAPEEGDAQGNQSGKVYIFDLTDGSLVFTLDNPNAFGTSSQDRFGDDVAISTNYAVVGVPSEDDASGAGSGKVYVYKFLDEVIEIPVDVSVNGTLTHFGNRNQTGNFEIAGEITNSNILIEDNLITTTNSNSDLELRAAGTGEIVIDPSDTVTIDNNLFVGGTLDYQGFLTINGNVVLQGNTQDGSLTVTENFSVNGTLDINSQAQFEDIRIEDNFITTTLSNSNLELRASGTGEILIPNNSVQVNNNLFTASITTTDITVNNDLVLDELVITDSNIEINENYITTKISNADLELRAAGDVVVQENAVVEQDLTVNGNTNLTDTNIVENITQTGDRTQTGDYTLTGNLNIGSVVTDREFQFDDVRISGNVLETTLSNSNLDLRAAGTGEVVLQENVQIDNNLTVGTFNVDSISVATSVDLEIIELSTDIQFEDNVIATTNSNSDLELRTSNAGSIYLQQIAVLDDNIRTDGVLDITLAPAENLIIDATGVLQLPSGTTAERKIVTGDIRFNSDDNVFEGTGATSAITFNGVYSADRLTSVTADPTSNNIRFIIDGAENPLDSTNLVGEVTGNGLDIHALQVDDILINNNTISTNVSNSDLDLQTLGTGELVIDDVSIIDNVIKNNSTNRLTFANTGFGSVKFNGTLGVVVPYGTTAEQPLSAEVGDTRWNTDTELLETWDGNQYVTSAGVSDAISEQEYNDLLLEYTLIFE